MEKVMFIEIGMGIDLHGQNVTKAAVRAVHNAIHHNSMPGLRSVLPNQDIHQMKVNVRLAVPADKDKLELDVVRAELPYGTVTFEVIDGGMLTSSGVVLSDKEDKNDLAYVVIASVEVGY
ncbi:Lin0512 family protein [Brevibacillus ruminantium]|uniref:Lin0512 family protein n=1 Tax=Brevibacillus ruminantium TaxID=2950604 RepID=A0ABY4WQJ3_9BACL|nr:Lin0512 family protein [Brevibacillus ruminantium]USG68423.1 Lin0512 family protein [Brevibacillus ruminantium]